jgi:hypothetical protein
MPAIDPRQLGQEAQRAYDEAIKQMTDRAILDRVRAVHPHANTGPNALKAMVEDYNRLKADADKNASGNDPKA